MLESLKHGVDLIGCQKHIPIEDAVVWRSVLGREIKVFTKPFVDAEYTKQQLGPRDYCNASNNNPKSVCGYCPRILQRQYSKDGKDYFYYPTGGRNLGYMHVVCSQIMAWLEQDCVRVLGKYGDSSFPIQAVLPWIVEQKKPRCCIDGSPFTCCAPRPKPKCHLDTAADLLKFIEKNDYFSIIDDQQGFLQARINEISQQLCRLQFGDLLLTHRGLAFGIHVSPPKFQNLNRVAVSTMNQAGFKTMLYLDDRLIIEKLLRELKPEETGIGVYSLLCLLVSFGGFVSPTKCNFFPVQEGRFLGFDFNTIDETVTVPQEKHDKVAAKIQLFEEGLTINGVEYRNMHLLEQIRGWIISWCLVVNNFGFYTREMNACIAAHYARFPGPRATDSLMKLDDITDYDFLIEELHVWRDLRYVKLQRKWVSDEHEYISIKPLELYTDASGGGLGSAIIEDGSQFDRKFTLPLWLAPLPIHCKEAYVILAAIHSYGAKYFRSRLLVWCDNRAVVDAWNGRGSRDLPLARILRQLCDYCHDNNIHLTIKWVDTENQLADLPSRELTPIFSRIKLRHAKRLVRYLHVNLDLFASEDDTVCPQYFTEYCSPSAAGMDGMTYKGNRDGDIVYAYPPRQLVVPFLKVKNETRIF